MTVIDTPRTAAPLSDEMQQLGQQAPRIAVGALLTSAAAALAAGVGLFAAQGIAHLHLLPGGLTEAAVFSYALGAAGFGLFACLVNVLMSRIAPNPTLFYSWLMALLVLLAVLVPFAAGITVTAAALAGVHLLIGIVVATLVPAATNLPE